MSSDQSTPNNVACVVLAAGQSSRFGSDKRLAAYDSRDTLLSKSIALAEPFCNQLFVITKPADDAIVQQLLGYWSGHPKLQQVVAPNANQGMGASLADAMIQLRDFENSHQKCFTGALVALADMPYITPGSIERVVAAHSMDNIVVPCYQGEAEAKRWGHPVLFGRKWFGDLRNLSGDRGGRFIVREQAGARVELETDDPGILRDVDSPDDVSAYDQ